MNHLIANMTEVPVHLTVRPDPSNEVTRLYIFSLNEVPRPNDAIASVWIRPERYVSIPMDDLTCPFRMENPAGAVIHPGMMDDKNAWFIQGFKN